MTIVIIWMNRMTVIDYGKRIRDVKVLWKFKRVRSHLIDVLCIYACLIFWIPTCNPSMRIRAHPTYLCSPWLCIISISPSLNKHQLWLYLWECIWIENMPIFLTLSLTNSLINVLMLSIMWFTFDSKTGYRYAPNTIMGKQLENSANIC